MNATEVLPTDIYRALVVDTLDELTGGPEADDEALAALIPVVDEDGLHRIVDVAAQLDGPTLPPEPELAARPLALRGDQVDVLLTLAEHLPPSGRCLLLQRVGTLSDLEQADAIIALLPRLTAWHHTVGDVQDSPVRSWCSPV